MTGGDIARAIGEQFFNLVLVAFFTGFGLGIFVSFGIPWIWSAMKPWLHTLTA